MPTETLTPAELMLQYDQALELVLCSDLDRPAARAEWERLRTILLGKLEMAFHEEMSGQ